MNGELGLNLKIKEELPNFDLTISTTEDIYKPEIEQELSIVVHNTSVIKEPSTGFNNLTKPHRIEEIYIKNEAEVLSDFEDKRFECELCNKKYFHKGSLLQHMKNHTNEETTVECKICKKKLKSSLLAHMRCHTGEKPFKCKICLAKFSRNSNLRSHQKIHTGEKPFICKICNKKYAHKDGLNQHMHTHSEEKEYQCDICQRKFTYKISLKEHMTNSHSNSKKSFKCQICDKEYVYSSSLSKHMKTHC